VAAGVRSSEESWQDANDMIVDGKALYTGIGNAERRNGENGEGEAHGLLHLDVLLGPTGPC